MTFTVHIKKLKIPTQQKYPQATPKPSPLNFHDLIFSFNSKLNHCPYQNPASKSLFYFYIQIHR